MHRLLPGFAWAALGCAIACGHTHYADAGAGDGGYPGDAGDVAGCITPVIDAGCPPNPLTGDFPIDVGTILRDRCQVCHKIPPILHAPFPLLRYEDVIKPWGADGGMIWQRMSQVIQTCFVPHMPLSSAPQLDAQQIQTLDAWFGACAPPVPEGTGLDYGGG